MKPDAIRPLHFSVRSTKWRKPAGLASAKVDPELRVKLTTEAIAVFTECVNAGAPFQEALLTVFASGMAFAVNALNDECKEPATASKGKRK